MEVLKRATTEIAGLRPALFSAEGYPSLDALRRFRHLFRHAYGLDLERAPVELLLEKARAVRALIRRDVGAFIARLRPAP